MNTRHARSLTSSESRSPSVAEFVASRDFARADEVKREILSLYRKDIAKAEAKDVQKITAIFDELPNQLARPGGSRPSGVSS